MQVDVGDMDAYLMRNGCSHYCVQGVVQELPTLLSSKVPALIVESTRLVIAEIPYGLTKHHWDTAATKVQMQNWAAALQVALVNAPFYVIIVFCSARQENFVVDVLANRLCNGPNNVMRCIWVKSNAASRPGQMLRYAHENIVLGFKSAQGRQEEMFNFLPKEMRVTVFQASTVTRPMKGADGVVLNSTQKPTGLLSYLIDKFSHEDDTVLDLFSGTGMFKLNLRHSHHSQAAPPSQPLP
jgi:hypothetical protein